MKQKLSLNRLTLKKKYAKNIAYFFVLCAKLINSIVLYMSTQKDNTTKDVIIGGNGTVSFII